MVLIVDGRCECDDMGIVIVHHGSLGPPRLLDSEDRVLAEEELFLQIVGHGWKYEVEVLDVYNIYVKKGCILSICSKVYLYFSAPRGSSSTTHFTAGSPALSCARRMNLHAVSFLLSHRWL